MTTKITGFLARNPEQTGNRLFLFSDKPIRVDSGPNPGWSPGGFNGHFVLQKESFPEVVWSDEPIKVDIDITLKEKSMV